MSDLIYDTPMPNHHFFVDRAESASSEGLEKIFDRGDLSFYWWRGGESPLPLEEVADLIEEGWSEDYGSSNQARFKYGYDYVEWFTQGDSCDGIMVRDTSGKLVGFLAIQKRVLLLNGEPVPTLYGALFTVALSHRKRGLAVAMNDIVMDIVMKRYGSMFMGALDGKVKNASYMNGVLGERKRQEKNDILVSSTRVLPFWAATNDLKKLLDYMPLSDGLNRVALNPIVRKVVEFKYREPAYRDYTVKLVNPQGVIPSNNPSGPGFVVNETLSLLYGVGKPEVGGTYRVEFESGRACDFYFIRHVASKSGLPDGTCAQIQIVDKRDASKRELARALKIVCNEFFKSGCFTVLLQNWAGIPSADLLKAKFLPSDRKIGIKFASRVEHKSEFLDLDHPLYFDLL